MDGVMASSLECCVRARAEEFGFTLNDAQRSALMALQEMTGRLSVPSSVVDGLPGARWLRRVRRPMPVQGVYLCGDVGRGKSFLMDAFYDCVPIERRARLHFHAFMQAMHERLAPLKGRRNPLALVAADLAREVRLLCLDEFQITDIGDAMLIRGLLQELFTRGVAIVMTANSEPAGLYPNGLQRERFLPTIALIKANMVVVPFTGDEDYRLAGSAEGAFGVSEQAFPALFRALTTDSGDGADVSMQAGTTLQASAGRSLQARCYRNGVAWFDFAELCAANLGKADYIALAGQVHTLLLSGVRQFDETSLDSACRFMWLVDTLYDHEVTLICSAAVPIQHLGHDGLLDGAFRRVRSRLTEMQSCVEGLVWGERAVP
ncbi:cell division protein ZapE [Halothiobacillus diazotrophicus]|nr:cell division protein ZapE [Halothiobacillus diazotrophicus]